MITLPAYRENDRNKASTMQPVPHSAERRQSPLDTEVNGERSLTFEAVATVLTCTQRDARGRFTKGNKLARGNPFNRRMASMRKVFANAVAPEEMRKLARQLYRAAMDGDGVAATLFLAYALDRPEKVVDPDSVDIDEWQRMRQLPVSPGEVDHMLHHIPAPTACSFVQYIWPSFVERFKNGLADIAHGTAPSQTSS